jgi:hypothetical protein
MKLTPSRIKAIQESTWPFNGKMYVAPKDYTPIPIKSVAELRRMTETELDTYKAEVCLARITAPTELEREQYIQQIDRIISIQNEYRPMEAYC